MGLVKRTYVDGETVITADNLNDIQDEIIQNASDISTKGTYSKPAGGIPSTDMTSAVQTSLEKADTALQSSDIDNTLTVSGKAADAKKTGDEISDVKNTLNHKADVIYDTASGSIASFPDGADGLPVKDLTVSIEPVQAGTGDPSPTNVRPISGWTGANVSRTGVNVWDEETQPGYYDATTGDYKHGATSQLCTKNFTPVKPNMQYLFRKAHSLGDILYYSLSKELIGSEINKPANYVFTTPENCYFIKMNLGSNYGSTYNHDLGINYPATDTAYHAYTGTTIPISWQSSAGTVYGGTLDVTSGVLTVDRAKAVVDGNNITADGVYPNDQGFYTSVISGIYDNTGAGYGDTVRVQCNILKSVPTNSVFITPYSAAQNGNTRFIINIPGISSISAANAWLSENKPEIIYYLATPLTYQLDPVTLSTLYGENNIFADCGPILNCEYRADTGLYINGKLVEIETLRSTIAPIEDGDTASQAYAQGKYFFHNGDFCKAKTAIASGATFTLNTNYEVTTVADELFTALNS